MFNGRLVARDIYVQTSRKYGRICRLGKYITNTVYIIIISDRYVKIYYFYETIQSKTTLLGVFHTVE